MYSYTYAAFGENNIRNVAPSESGLTLSDLVVESIDANRVELAISHPLLEGITMSSTGNFAFTGTPANLSSVTGKVLTASVFINGVLNESETWSGGADVQQLLDFEYTSSLLSGDDSFEGSTTFGGDDSIQGLGGNDRFKGYGDGQYSDYFFGGDGRDTSIYRGKLSEYVVKSADDIWDVVIDDGTRVKGLTVQDTVQSRDGKDFLNEVERLTFSDKSIALDVGATENAGKAKLFTGAIAHSLSNDAATLGTILNFVDNGYSDLTSLSQLAISVGLVSKLAGGDSNEALADLVTTNLLGQANPIVATMLTSYMDGTVATYSQAQFLAAVAALEVNQQHVDLVGLAQTGMEYVPVGL